MRKLLTIFSVTILLLLVSIGNAEDLTIYGPTKASDHLWHIAQTVRPNREVSKQQTMVAIFNANPQAFSSNNVNGLRAGYRLTIPTLAQIKAIPALSALIEISAQNSAWINRVNFDASALKQVSKSPPFGTLRGAKTVAGRQVHTVFSLPDPTTTEVLPLTFSPSEILAQPLSFIETLLSEQANLPIDQTQKPFTKVHTLPPSADFSLPPSSYITAATAEKMIKNGIATHISNLTQKLDNFLIQFNQDHKLTQQRLDIIADEHVAMKNQIASLDKQMQQLRENYLQYSTPIFRRSAFSDYGIWIMGSSVLACLLVLIFTTSRRRQVSIRVKESAKGAVPTLSDTIEAIEDEYDYLGSQEGIAAKLDLARAYIDMGDTTQASHVLKEVIAHGNEEQRFTARKILSDLTTDTVH